MIIDFTVANYRSIREPVTLSFVAQKGRLSAQQRRHSDSADEVLCSGYPVEGRDFTLLPIAAIFGANASGKSNVIRALDDLISLMVFSRPNSKSPVRNFSSFELTLDSVSEPTTFSLRLSFKGKIFTFSLKMKKNLVIEEHLEYSPIPKSRQSVRLLYKRTLNEDNGEYINETGEYFSGPHVQLINSVKGHDLYFNFLYRLNVPVISDLTRWAGLTGMGSFCGDEEINFKSAASWFHEQEDDKEKAIFILQQFDTSLSDIKIDSYQDGGETKYYVEAIHNVEGKDISWDFNEESLGTQRLFILLSDILTALQLGHGVVVDEFGANFHPQITRTLINLFHNKQTNPLGAQLIFTSHDNTLWRGVLRRDEIWLTEKKPDLSTDLIPLSAFKPRNDLALDKAYLDGRFGGVPLIGDIVEILSTEIEEQLEEYEEILDVS